MEELAWSDALRTGIDVIDRQHRGLVDMINATAARMAGEAELGADEVRLLVGYLKDYAEVHFSTEEALMGLCGLEAGFAQAHHHNHVRFLDHVGDMIEDLGHDAAPDGRQLLSFLGDWLIRHIKGEDQGLARRLRAAQQLASETLRGASQSARAAGLPVHAPLFADALAQGSAALHASEAEVLAMIEADAAPALVIELDAALLPGEVIHANGAAAALFGKAPAALVGRPGAELFGPAQWQRFPVVISEVLMHGGFEGELQWLGPDRTVQAGDARIAHLVLGGRMVILVVLAPAAEARADAAQGDAAADAGLRPGRPRRAARAAATVSGSTVLSRHPLFRRLGPEVLSALEQPARLVRLHKWDVLYRRGERPAGLYIVVSGQMSVVAASAGGDEKVIDIVDAAQVLGEVEVFTGQVSPTLARSLSSTVLLMIPAEAMHAVLAASPDFAADLVAHLGRRVHERTAEIEALSLHTAMERIIDFLLVHAATTEEGVVESVLPAQKGVVASYLNISAATLSRAFQQLTDNGLITISRRYVTIPDRDALLRFRDQGVPGRDGVSAGLMRQ